MKEYIPINMASVRRRLAVSRSVKYAASVLALLFIATYSMTIVMHSDQHRSTGKNNFRNMLLQIICFIFYFGISEETEERIFQAAQLEVF